MNENKIQLNRLYEGEWARVEALDSGCMMRRRLQDIGLIEGTRVECLQKSPSGDPMAYLVRGTVIALRRNDAERIEVLP